MTDIPLRLPGHEQLSLGGALFAYAFAVALCLIVFMVLHFIWFALAFYILAGVFLNRHVLRRLAEWHPLYATVDVVARGKAQMLLLWPLAYPVLFIRVAIAKYL